MGKVIRLTESDLNRIVRKVIEEQSTMDDSCLKKMGFEYNPPTNKSLRQGPFANRPGYYEGTYQGKRALFYLNGYVRVLMEQGSMMHKTGDWKCESGKLKVFNLSELKRMMPM